MEVNKSQEINQPQEELSASSDQNQPPNNNQFLDNELFLLIIILLIFFQNSDLFSEKFKLLNNQVQTVRDYLDAADDTLQTLKQASEIPSQRLN